MSVGWWVALGIAVAVVAILVIAVSSLVVAGRADRLSEQMGAEAPVFPLAEARDKRARDAQTSGLMDKED